MFSSAIKSNIAIHSVRLVKMVAVGLLSGFVAGIVAGGIGSRIAMRILAALNPSTGGVMTENGNVSGQITIAGTFDLIAFAAIFPGLFGGLLYVLFRHWIPGSGVRKGLAFGLVLFLIGGALLFNGDSADFGIFGPKALGVALFALLFPLYGMVVSLVAERLNRYVPPLFSRPVPTRIGHLVLAALCGAGLFATVQGINDMV